MSDELKGAIITAIVTGSISIIGFVVTYNSMKKNFKNELEKENYEKANNLIVKELNLKSEFKIK